MRYNLEECSKFYAGKRVLVTGHTGFKGTWLCRILMLAGAEVTGYSLNPPTEPSVYGLLDMETSGIKSVIGDVRDLAKLRRVLRRHSRRSCFIWLHSPLCGIPTGSRCILMKQMLWEL